MKYVVDIDTHDEDGPLAEEYLKEVTDAND